MDKKHFTIGCCGIDCGLCPRFYTEGSSKCPGCGGPGFREAHPSCAVLNCCYNKHKLEICSLCKDFPCGRYNVKEKIEKDSFITHKRIFYNFDFVKNHGLAKFIKEQKIRMQLLNILLEKYNDNRSKNYYCLATALLSTDNINNILQFIKNNEKTTVETLKNKINEYAEKEKIELKLIKH